MASRSLKAVLTAAITASFALAAVPAQAAADPDPFVWTKLTPTYTATGAYAYEPFAAKGGYERTDECVPNMGYHYVNPKYINSLDPARPAALLYEDGKRGKRELVAVEWVVEDKGQATPKLFGRKFDEGQLPGHFTLHAWIYKSNPKGLLEAFNPKVKCPTPKP
ncbi:hypothetical protein STRCI_004763 [Streptomyces cinnabarinus]|uniref:Secreted protein n=1 Tax=Streptomyces cinnabarinus TaxID=67287 RepID=A0ABY7KK00_9ACTN|nr:hypothetical protein [Streptomyces cinnabarinus]WAZ23422.1 hypothetical protein STRCI_004763 [Streptomyces cinnabarinus]